MPTFGIRSKWPMDDELHERVSASLAAAGLADAVAELRSPRDRGATRWALDLTDASHGADVTLALARLSGVCRLRDYSAERITFDVDRTVPGAGRPADVR